jgi:hypothetical protein
MILKGKSYENPGGYTDDWHKEETHYGLAFADFCVPCKYSGNCLGVYLSALGILSSGIGPFLVPIGQYKLLTQLFFALKTQR